MSFSALGIDEADTFRGDLGPGLAIYFVFYRVAGAYSFFLKIHASERSGPHTTPPPPAVSFFFFFFQCADRFGIGRGGASGRRWWRGGSKDVGSMLSFFWLQTGRGSVFFFSRIRRAFRPTQPMGYAVTRLDPFHGLFTLSE